MSETAAPVKEKRSGRSKAFTIVGIVLCVILVPILVINVTMIIKSYANPSKVPTIFGYSPMIVQSGSMEKTIMTGDLIIVKEADPSEVKGESSKGARDGTIISYFDPDLDGKVTTHRCIEVITEADGSLSFRTRGDNNPTEDFHTVPASSLVGIYQFRIPGMGDIAMWLQSTPGLIVCIAVPIVLLVGYDLIMKKRYDKSKKKDTDALLAELEELRAKAAEKDSEEKPSAESKTVEPVKTAEVSAPAEETKPAEAKVTAEKAKASPDADMARVDALIDEITNEDKNS